MPPPKRTPLTKFDPRFYVRGHELAKSGMTNTQIAGALGVSPTVHANWIRNDEAYREALEKGRDWIPKEHDENGNLPTGPGKRNPAPKPGETFLQFVYKRLPDNLKDVFDEIVSPEVARSPEGRVQALLSNQGILGRQQLWVHCLVHANFNPSEACRLVNVSKAELDGWIRDDPGFCDLVDEIQWHRKNFCEGALMGLVAQGDVGATVFVNRTLNRDRGYDPKITVEHKQVGNGPQDVLDLEIPIETKRIILAALRKKREAEVVTARLALNPGDPDATER